MTKRELIKALLEGKKMTSDEFAYPDKTYCVYDDSYINPFRFIDTDGDSDIMEGVWDYTNWREVKEQLLEPKNGEKWFYIYSNGKILSTSLWSSDDDLAIVNQGRVFKTKEEARAFSEWEQAAFKLKKYIFELNGNRHRGFNTGSDNYIIIYDTQCKELLIRKVYFEKSHQSWLYLDSKEEAEQLINDMEKDLLTYFKY